MEDKSEEHSDAVQIEGDSLSQLRRTVSFLAGQLEDDDESVQFCIDVDVAPAHRGRVVRYAARLGRASLHSSPGQNSGIETTADIADFESISGRYNTRYLTEIKLSNGARVWAVTPRLFAGFFFDKYQSIERRQTARQSYISIWNHYHEQHLREPRSSRYEACHCGLTGIIDPRNKELIPQALTPDGLASAAPSLATARARTYWHAGPVSGQRALEFIEGISL